MHTLALNSASSLSTKIETKVSTTARADNSIQRKSLAASDCPRVVGGIFDSLGVENYHVWAWDNYKRVVTGLCDGLGARRIIEIGGGRDPLFDRAEIDALGVEMTINDISPRELAVLPPVYKTACFDVAGDIDGVAYLRGTLDLAFSRMVFEHVENGRQAWANLYEMLAPGGVALAFMPTLYALPFTINWLLPHKLTSEVVKRLQPHRTDEADPVFPARYSWCSASDRVRAMLSQIGYREIVILPFYGHFYYIRFPFVRAVHERFTDLARNHDWRSLATYAYIAVRK